MLFFLPVLFILGSVTTSTLSTRRKVTVFGSTGVGKTSICFRIVNDRYFENEGSTIGLAYHSKEMRSPDDKRKVQVEFWDTAGQERYDSMTQSYLRGSDLIIAVYDVTARESFEKIDVKLSTAIESAFIEKPKRVILVGNKIDAPEDPGLNFYFKRAITEEEGRKLAEKYECLEFFEVSAKTGNGCDELSSLIAEQMTTTNLAKSPAKKGTVTVEASATAAQQQCGCCFSSQ